MKIFDTKDKNGKRSFTTIWLDDPIRKGDVIIAGTTNKDYIGAIVLVDKVEVSNFNRFFEVKRYTAIGYLEKEEDVNIDFISKRLMRMCKGKNCKICERKKSSDYF